MSEDILEKNIIKEETENNFEKYVLITSLNEKTYYQCKLCNFASNIKNILKNHLNKKNKCYITDTTECQFCKKKFRDKTILKKHMEKLKKCYLTTNSNIEIKIEQNKNSTLEKLEHNEEKLKKQILQYEEENKNLKESIVSYKESNDKMYNELITNIHDYYFQTHINKKIGNFDLILFTNNFLMYNKYDTRIMEYKDFIINLLDRCDIELIDKIFKDIEIYNKLKNFEELFKYYQQELEKRVKNNDFKKTKHIPVEFQLHKINTFIKNHYNL